MKARYWYIDSLRACLMLGGVFFHAALVYSVYTPWVVNDAVTHRLFDVLAKALASFRMPAFFVLAGFFCAHLMKRRPLREVLFDRALLIVLPFITMALTLQPLQYAIKLAHEHRLTGMSVGGFLLGYVSPDALVQHPFFGHAFVGHLWFLLDLLSFYGLAALVTGVLLLKRWAVQASHGAPLPVLLRHKLLWALLSAGLLAGLGALLRSTGLNPDFGVQQVLRYLPYFAIGAAAFAQDALFEAFMSVDLLELAALPAVLAVEVFEHHTGLLHDVLILLCQMFVAVMVTVLLLRLFRRFFNRRWAWQQRLVDASFSVYLFHHVCVVGGAVLLARWHGMPVFGKYALLVAGSIALPLAVHAGLVTRHPWLRLLINGRRRPGGGWPQKDAPHSRPAVPVLPGADRPA